MNYVIVALMLIIYGVLFIIIENYNKTRTLSATKIKEITWKNALYIGVFQLLSIVPGTSRSGATIIGGILLGCSRELASEYTFFLAVPVMFGASLLKLVKHGFAFTGVEVAHAGGICGIDFCHQIPDAVHQEARFQSLRLVPYRTRCDCAAVFRNQNRNSESIKSNNSENLPGKIEEEVS